MAGATSAARVWLAMCRVGRVTGGVSHTGGIMKIMSGLAMATVAAAGLMFATNASAVADVSPHKHCLYLDCASPGIVEDFS